MVIHWIQRIIHGLKSWHQTEIKSMISSTRICKHLPDIIMAYLCNRAGHYIFISCGFFFIRLLSVFSSPNLSRHTLDVYHTSSTHGVALVQISNAGLKCAARGSLKIVMGGYSHLVPSGHLPRFSFSCFVCQCIMLCLWRVLLRLAARRYLSCRGARPRNVT